MGVSLEALRKFVALDPEDGTMRFALGQKLYEEVKTPEGLAEAVGHLRAANAKSPGHCATYYVLGCALVDFGARDEAVEVLKRGYDLVVAMPEAEGHDLAPAIQELLDTI